jgi:hypothetical protein
VLSRAREQRISLTDGQSSHLREFGDIHSSAVAQSEVVALCTRGIIAVSLHGAKFNFTSPRDTITAALLSMTAGAKNETHAMERYTRTLRGGSQ